MLIGLQTGCTQSISQLKPGDRVNEMTVTNTEPPTVESGIATYCDVPNGNAPTVITVPCKTVPALDALDIEPGWSAPTQQELEENWAALQWEVFIDGQKLDLQSFGTVDVDGGEGRLRSWRVWLEHLTPGSHSVRVLQRVTTAIPDDEGLIAVGDYDTTYQFTVQAKSE